MQSRMMNQLLFFCDAINDSVDVACTYDVAADDVVFPKPLAKICKLAVFRFLSCSSIAKGERLFTYR